MSLKKTIQLSAAIATLLALSIMESSTSAYAAVAADGQSATTTSNLKLIDQFGPVAPTDPGKPVKPIDPNPITPSTGDLRLDYISNLHFGQNELSGSEKTYYAEYDQVADLTGHRDPATGAWVTDKLTNADYYNVPTYVQVTNKKATKWNLKVNNSQFKTGSGSVLTGAILKMEKIVSHNVDPNATLGVNSEVSLVGDSTDQVFVDAGANSADTTTGTWTFPMGEYKSGEPKNEAVSLYVPGSTEKVKTEVYTSELTWTLADTSTP